MRPAATVRSTLPLTLVALPLTLAGVLGAACYSPNDDVVPTSATGDDGESGSSSDTDDGVASSAESASSASSASSAGSATSASSTSASSTSADPSDSTGSSPTETSADASTGEPADPYCGDGNVDPGEECDLGGDNALTAECRPDCNLARCGDGDVWAGGEGCDDGDGNNVLEIGACAPDCSRVIEEKVITGGNFIVGGGDFGNNPVASVDSTCDPGYAAMFVVAGIREASASPYAGDGGIDWVLQPYTAYVTTVGELVWITDATPLLGVRDGEPEALLAPIYEENFSFSRLISGLNADWTSSISNTCNGWSSDLESDQVRYGDPTSVTGYLVGSIGDCAEWSVFASPIWLSATSTYCVEQ